MSRKILIGGIVGILLGTVGVVWAFSDETTTTESLQLGAISPVLDSIFGLSHKKATNKKANEIAKINSIPKVHRISVYGDYYIEIQSITAIEGGISVLVRAWDSNNDAIGFGKDGTVEIETFNIYNPSILVRDDVNGTIEDSSFDRNLGKIVVQKFREDLEEALLQDIEHTISVKQQKHDDSRIILGKIGNTTNTFYPQADATATSSADGNPRRNAVNETFDTIRNGVGKASVSANTNDGCGLLEASATSNQYDDLSKCLMSFDTSTLNDTDTIDSAIFSIYANTVSDQLGANFELVVTKGSMLNITSTADADYEATTGADFDFQYADRIDFGAITTGQYNNYTLYATSALANISKTATSTFATRSYNDVYDTLTGITWANAEFAQINHSMADASGQTQDPKLVVETTVAVVAIPQSIKSNFIIF